MRESRGAGLVVAAVAAGLILGGATGGTTAASEPAPAPEVAAVGAPAVDAPAVQAVAPGQVPARVVGAARPAPGLVAGTPCSATARACIDLSARRAWLIRDGVVRYGPVPITSGKPGHRTPTGTFRVAFKDVDHLSHEFNDAPMPNSVFFNGGIAFHQGSLALQSHGCIHLSRAASRTFFASLHPDDVVQVRA